MRWPPETVEPGACVPSVWVSRCREPVRNELTRSERRILFSAAWVLATSGQPWSPQKPVRGVRTAGERSIYRQLSIDKAPGSSSGLLTDDEAGWIARIRGGDEAACEALYRRYHEPLWRFAYRYVRCADAAEEIVHDVFLALWRDRAACDVAGPIRAWLYGAVRHHALNHLRHERVVTRFSEQVGTHAADAEVTAMGAPPPDVHDALEAGDLADAVHRALAALPERRRLAMTLRWKHDLSSAEIARVLGTTDASVRVLLTRARSELASLLNLVRR